MNSFDVWMEFYSEDEYATTDAVTIFCLNAKQALFQGFSLLQAYVPESLSIDDISLYVQSSEES